MESNKGQELTPKTSVTEIISAIDAKMASIKQINDSVFITSCKIQMAGGSVDIREEKDPNILVKALGSIIARAKSIEDAYKALGVETYPIIKVDGSTVEDWIKDVKLKNAILDQKETLDELTSIKKEWEDLMSREDKKDLLFKKMQKFAGVTAE